MTGIQKQADSRDFRPAAQGPLRSHRQGHLLICLNGNYEEQQVTSESYETLVDFTAKMADRYDVPIENIKTHRDYASGTVCPGENLYAYFQSGTFYQDVKALLYYK